MYFPVLYVFGLIANVQYMVRNAESTVGITVFFNEDMSEDDIQKIGDEIRSRDEVKEVKYVSAEEAWENFKKEYFKESRIWQRDLRMTTR